MTDEELEANSCKYTAAGVIALSTGSFAVYRHFSNKSGMPLETIVWPEDLWALLRQLQEDNTAEEPFHVMPAEPSPLDAVLAALVPPTPKIKRRM